MCAENAIMRVTLLWVLCSLCFISTANAQFSKIGDVSVGSVGHGIAFDGTAFHVAERGNYWRNYTTAFVATGTTTYTTTAETRGLSYDPIGGTLFAGDFTTGTVREATLGGTTIQNWTTGFGD